MQTLRWLLLTLALASGPGAAGLDGAEAGEAFVRVSPRDVRYLELSDGRPYVPIGLNLIAPNTRDAEGLARMEEWLGRLAAQRGNYARVWLSSPFWDVEHQRAGVFDEEKARRIDALLAMARKHGIRLKLTLEHFREMSETPRQRWANKPLHLQANGGAATNMADFFSGEASRAQFRKKLAWYAARYGSQPVVFGWELWNEVNAVTASEQHYLPWTAVMLEELHRLFPRNLALQSLGSYDTARVRELYCRHSVLPGNDLAQVHRYLDLGATLEVCRGPVDVLAADAIREILACRPGRPVILAESGAVEPRHTGPFKLYARDTNGLILHDVLFAPFFAGAAGAGQIWHWDVYVDRNQLWWHFGRFAEAVKDLDPPAEHWQPDTLAHDRLRVLALRGPRTVLLWCRDANNTWQTELEQGRAPETLAGLELALGPWLDGKPPARVRWYDPWKHQWGVCAWNGRSLRLPPVTRSLVVRVDR